MPSGPESAPQRLPDRIGRYEVLLPLASGGMGTVYLARARGVGGFEREVAIKLLHAHLRDVAGSALDLIEEAKLAVRIRHPNVVPVFDVGDDPLGFFLVMDYIEGDTLSGLTRRTQAKNETLPIRIGLRVLIDALAGLHAAHELRDDAGKPLGMVHRDFSPQNILVGVDGIGRLTDFGIAKAASRLSHTNTGIVKGKIGYMSPEQAKAEPVDRRCDVWAAGVVAWQIISGQRLHPAENEVGTLLKIVTNEPPRLRDVAPKTSAELDDVVHRTLTLKIEDRIGTAQALRQALTAACRRANEWAETEEVAEYVTTLVGPKLAERRTRMKDLSELRARIGQFTATTPSSMSKDPVAVPPLPPPNQSADIIVTLDARSPVTAAKAVSPAAPMEKERTGTDTTSVAGADAYAPRRSAPRLRFAALLALAATAGGAFFLFRSKLHLGEVAPAVSEPAVEAPGPVAPPASSSAATPVSSESPATVTEPPRPLAVHANSPIVSLSVGDRVLPMPSPTRDVVIDLLGAESQGTHIDAISADGRKATVKLQAGATRVSINFPARPPSLARPPADNPPPLAPIPYGK